MKLHFPFLALFLTLSFIWISCGKDPVVNTDPTLTSTVAENDTIKAIANQGALLKVSGIKGSAELNSVEILENDTLVKAFRVGFKGTNVGVNPIVLLDNDRQGFNAEVRLRTSYVDAVSKLTIVLNAADGKSTKISRWIKSTKTNPIISYVESNPVNAATPGADHSFRLSVSGGSAPVTQLLVKENGINITDVSRLKFDTLNFFTNPFIFPEAQNAFTSKKVTVRMPLTPGKWEYSFTFVDSLGGSASQNVTAYVGTKLNVSKTAVLNNSADASTGGLDLDAAAAVSSSNPEAEIIDAGIDPALPATSNWKQKILPAPGAEMRWVISSANINDIVVKEQISTYWNLGTPIPNGTPNKVLTGDTFVVLKNGIYYFIQVSKVNATPGDNADSIELGVKW